MKPKGKNSGGPIAIGNIICRVLQTCRPEADQALVGVWNLWDDAVGPAISANAQPAAFRGRILIVHVSSSTWIHHLQFLKKDILEKLNAAFGRDLVVEIRFKIGPVATMAPKT